MSEPVQQTKEAKTAERIAARGALVVYSKKGGLLSGLFGGKAKRRPFPVRRIGPDGLSFVGHERLRPGTKLRMTIRVSDRGPNILVVGRVVESKERRGSHPYQVDVTFVNFKGKAWHVLSHLSQFAVVREDSTTSLLRMQTEPAEEGATEEGQRARDGAGS